MPKKVRELMTMLEKAGFVNRGGKGGHKNYIHPSGVKITLSGNAGEDALRYQEKQVGKVIAEVEK